MTRDEALQRIKKLLAVADMSRGATQAEAEQAAARAATLMAEHGIESAAALEQEHAPERPIENATGGEYKQADAWRGIVSGGVEAATGTKCHWTHVQAAPPAPGMAPGPMRRGFRWYGTRDAIQAAIYMQAMIEAQIDRLAGMRAGSGRAWLNSYRIGLASGVSKAMRAAAQASRVQAEQAATASGSTALVRLDREAVALRQTWSGLKLRAGRGYSFRSGDGYRAGLADSGNIRTGGGLGLGAGQRRIQA